jgi:phenylacetate-CoA ligase
MYSKIFRNLFFPLMEYQQKTNIQEHLGWLNKTQWWSKEELKELQNKKLRALINHVYNNVKYYHRIFKEENIYPDDIRTCTDLKKIPVLTKEIIRKNFHDFIGANVHLSNVIEFHSSGSTGEPLKYYHDKSSYSSGWAQTFRSWSWAGYKIGDPYVKISLNPRMTLRKKIQDRLLNTKYIYASWITGNNLNKQLGQIKKFNPGIIRGYASYMFGLSKLMEKFDVQYSGATVATTGDTLFPHYRKAIEKQFNCRVFDAYGGESTPISYECEEHNGYHISDEDVIVEFIKDEEYVSAGETGRIIFTNLNNYAFPFIRYDINDLGKFSDEKCSCGRGLSVMRSIEGRDTDLVVTPGGDFVVVHFFTILFEYIEGVDQFQVIQERINKLNIKIIKNKKFSQKDLNYIINEVQKKVGPDVEINIESVDEIPLTMSGKRRFVISKVPLDF